MIERAGRFSLCVQNEQPPYQYVSVEGPVSVIEPADVERDARPLAQRYFGVDGGNDYIAEIASSSEEYIVIRMRPERWLTADYTE